MRQIGLFSGRSLLLCLIGLGAGCYDSQYACTTDDNCVNHDLLGTCQPAPGGGMYCAFDASECDSQMRWDINAPSAFAGECVKPRCDDGIKNGSPGKEETDVDCGGPVCGRCDDKKMCHGGTDCKSNVCRGGTCQVPSCADTYLNGDETDQDCGGSCSPCADKMTCLVDHDCSSHTCRVANHRCAGILHYDSACQRVGGKSQAMATGDFNKDGLPDLVVATDEGKVLVLLGAKGGLGDRTLFSSPVDVGNAALQIPQRVVAADLDKDGNLDFAVVDHEGLVLVFFGTGQGTFSMPVSLRADPKARDLIIADVVGGDGVLDLAVAIENSNDPVVDEFKGLGNRGFGPSVQVPVPHDPMSMVLAPPLRLLAGDFDDDGKTDIAVATGPDIIRFILSTGAVVPDVIDSNGPFGPSPSRMLIARISGNHDKDDIVIAGSQGLSVFLRDTSQMMPAQFQEAIPRQDPPIDAANDLVSGDFNSDGRPDYAAIISDRGTLHMFLTKSDDKNNAFPSSARAIYYVGANPLDNGMAPMASGVAGEFNGDGMLDLAVLVEAGGSVCVLPGDGQGSFGDGVSPTLNSYAIGDNANGLAWTDFDGDGKPDLAMISGNTMASFLTLLYGNGIFAFKAVGGPFALGGSPSDVAVGLLDGDQSPDIAIANSTGTNVDVFINRGGKIAGQRNSYDYHGKNPSALAIGDFNQDGSNDLVVANRGDSTVTVLLGNGTGLFPQQLGNMTSRWVTFPTAMAPIGLSAADLNGDGLLDLVVASAGGTVTIHYGAPKEMGKDVIFKESVSYAIGASAVSVAIVDFDSDKKPDLLIGSTEDNTMQFWFGTGVKGANAFGQRTYAPKAMLAGKVLKVVAGDLDGNGTVDMAALVEGGLVEIVLGDGAGKFAAPALFSTAYGSDSMIPVDWNTDRTLDLVLSVNHPSGVTLMLNDAY